MSRRHDLVDVAFGVLALVALGLLFVVWAQQGRHSEDMRVEREASAAERQVLLERIQRPERPVTAAGAPEFVAPDPVPDDSHLVGTIAFEDD